MKWMVSVPFTLPPIPWASRPISFAFDNNHCFSVVGIFDEVSVFHLLSGFIVGDSHTKMLAAGSLSLAASSASC